ncbi:unnamed protein product [Phyllotreta striolata]|uniref:Uncharacterized protein n=1 Tax=Phyllotreta striolata TaxID=444603 RepID=A0A9N9XRN0_PHYSR|nr:unnamed protein product [Phyllotreta striolata]
MNFSHLFLIALTVLAISGYANSNPEPRNDRTMKKRQEVLEVRRRQAEIEHKEDLKRRIAEFKARRRQKELDEVMKRHSALRHQRLAKSRADQNSMGRRRSSSRYLRGGKYPVARRNSPMVRKRQDPMGLGSMARRRQSGKFADQERFLPMPFAVKRLKTWPTGHYRAKR